MTWHHAHRRYELVEAVLAAGEPTVPAALQARVDAEFGDFGGFLREVQARWYRAFDARLDAVLEDGPADMDAALAELWRDLAGTMPAVRRLLDVHADHPVVAASNAHHRRRLHAATGVLLNPVQIAEPRPPRPERRRLPRFVCPRPSTA